VRMLPKGDARPSQDMTLTPRAKRVIDIAYDEARLLGNDYIGTEHLLLGLLREGDGVAARVLVKKGLETEGLRAAVRGLQENDGRPAVPTPPPTPPLNRWDRYRPTARRAIVAADAAAKERGQGYVSPEHLLLGLLAAPETYPVRALAALGVDPDALRAEVERNCRTTAPPARETAFSPASDKAFDLAYGEQLRFGDERTGAGHLLLGLLREPDGIAGRLLERHGVQADPLRERLRRLRAEDADES
jgi:ATP-dependent Clp protease ATP-binding subunit ClpA